MIAEWAESVSESRDIDAMAALEFYREQLVTAAQEESISRLVPEEFVSNDSE